MPHPYPGPGVRFNRERDKAYALESGVQKAPLGAVRSAVQRGDDLVSRDGEFSEFGTNQPPGTITEIYRLI